MTAPLPMTVGDVAARFVNAVARHANRLLRARIGELNRQIGDAMNTNHALRDAANYQASDAAGYIDRTGLEA